MGEFYCINNNFYYIIVTLLVNKTNSGDIVQQSYELQQRAEDERIMKLLGLSAQNLRLFKQIFLRMLDVFAAYQERAISSEGDLNIDARIEDFIKINKIQFFIEFDDGCDSKAKELIVQIALNGRL